MPTREEGIMQHNTGSQLPTRRANRQVFTASEIGEYEYCPLAWWYSRYESHVEMETDELFAELVEMEQAHGPQAPTLPEYQFIEQLLVQRDAFEEGRRQHSEHARQVAGITDLEEIAEEYQGETGIAEHLPQMRTNIFFLAILSISCIIISIMFLSH
jgi:hypothetical protein